MSIPRLFDVHTHTQFHAFSEDVDLVIQRALDAGVWMVNVGTQRDTSENAISFAEKFSEGVYATVGLHPIHTEKSHHDAKEFGDSSEEKGFTSRGEEFDFEYYKRLAKNPKVVAIGECGLDYYRLEAETKKKQEETFLGHIRVAKEVEKPLMIHCRKAFDDLISVLLSHQNDLPNLRGINHFFTGTIENAKKLLDLGFSFSFGGVITFTEDYNGLVRFIPLDRIVLETDAPYVAPVPYRGKRNEPLYVQQVSQKISELKFLSIDEVAEATTKNALQIFSIKEPSL
jgi:TatD DNase family protein